MPSDIDAFAKACKSAARDLRRMPKQLRAELKQVVSDDVADWLLGRIQNRATGVEKRLVYRTRKSEEPTITIGGTARVASGGAKGRELVYGYEFGGAPTGGKQRTTWYDRTSPKGRRHHVKRRSTMQFPRPPAAFIYPTIVAEWDETSRRWIAALDPILKTWEEG